MNQEYDSGEVRRAFNVIKAEMCRDNHDTVNSWASAWHCNIAMMCYDAILASNKNQLGHETALEIGNDAASRFMQLCFDVKTSKDPK